MLWMLSFSTDISTGPGRWAILCMDRWFKKKGLAWLWEHSERGYALRYGVQCTPKCYFALSLTGSLISVSSAPSKVGFMGTLEVNSGQNQNNFKFQREKKIMNTVYNTSWTEAIRVLEICRALYFQSVFQSFLGLSWIYSWDLTWNICYLELDSLLRAVVYLPGWAKDGRRTAVLDTWQVDQKSRGPEVGHTWANEQAVQWDPVGLLCIADSSLRLGIEETFYFLEK